MFTGQVSCGVRQIVVQWIWSSFFVMSKPECLRVLESVKQNALFRHISVDHLDCCHQYCVMYLRCIMKCVLFLCMVWNLSGRMLFVSVAQKCGQMLSFDPDVVLNGYRLQEEVFCA